MLAQVYLRMHAIVSSLVGRRVYILLMISSKSIS